MDQATLNRLLDEAFEIWAEIVNFDPDRSVWHGLDQIHVRQQAEEIQEARQLDPTGLTAFMFMKAITWEFIEAETVTALDVIRGLSPEQEARIATLRRIHNFLERPEVDAIIEDFVSSVRDAVEHYGIGQDDLEAWLGNYYWMAILRRDALRAAEKLEAHQFFHGQEADSDRCVYSTKIWEFWNIPSLVRAMQAQGKHGFRGINLCLIRDPEEALFSFFVVAIINGQSITVLTDRTQHAHPAGKSMSRRPDREFERRAAKNWFPYELLNIKATVDQRRLYAEARTALVPINARAVKLADFSELQPADAIWLSLLFQVLRERFLEKNKQLPELSYTTEMIRRPHLLVAGKLDIVEAGKYQPLVVEPFTHTDITADATAPQWEPHPVGHNEWMIERYGEQVPAEAFNIVGDEERDLLELPSHFSALAKSDEFRLGPSKPRAPELKTMDPLGFGTREQIERDRQWTARYNQCQLVQRLAEREFKATEKEIRAWVTERLEARTDWLIEQAVRADLTVTVTRRYFAGIQHEGGVKTETYEHPLVDVEIGKNPRMWGRNSIYIPPIFEGENALGQRREVAPRCAITGTKTISYVARVAPEDANSVATILGCTFDELPWQLQVWASKIDRDYTGNHLLNRLDPSDWVLHNPWVQSAHWTSCSFPISAIVWLSKRGVNRRRKELGLPKLDWSNPEALRGNWRRRIKDKEDE